MLEVHKYKLVLTDDIQDFTLKEKPQFLHFAEQRGEFCMWVLENLDTKKTTTVHVMIVATGQPLPYKKVGLFEDIRHLSTILVNDGNIVWHLFEIRNK